MHTNRGHLDVGGREPEQPAALVAHHHLAAHLVQAPEHVRRPGDVAAGEGAADRRRAERLAHAVEPLDQLDRADREVVGAAELLEQVDVAATVGAEVEVLADDDGAARGARARGRDWTNDSGDSCDCSSSNGSTTVASMPVAASSSRRCSGIGEQLGRRLRPDDHRRVAVEREHHRAGGELGGDRAHLIDDRLVSEVDAVVGADRDDGAFARPRCRVELGDHLHGARRYRAVLSTTRRGLASAGEPNGS